MVAGEDVKALQEALAAANQRLMRSTFLNFTLACGLGLVTYKMFFAKSSLEELEGRLASYEQRIADCDLRSDAAAKAVDAHTGWGKTKRQMGDAVKHALFDK